MPKFVKYYDANRVRKTYPLVRLKPKPTEITNINASGLNVEVAVIDYVNSSSETYTFVETYTAIPVIAVTPESENVNLYITALTTTSVTIESSAPFNGKVHLHVYEDEE